MKTSQDTITLTATGEFSGALSIVEFARRYKIGRSSVYAEIRDGKLPIRKCRGRSLIMIGDAERWAASLPVSSR